jgi:outer membrane protein assembly factor BamB
VATNDGTLVALTRDTGEISWESDVGNLVSYALVEGNTVVVRGHGSGDATLYALDADSGEERWTGLTRGTGVTAGFALLDTTQELVLARDITDTFGNELPLHAVSLADGSTRWTTDVGSQGGTIIHDGTIYYNGYDGVTAFAPDGTRRWEWTLDNAGFNHHVQRTALVCDHVIVSTKTDSSGPGDEYAVHGVNIETGEGEWTVEFDAWDPGIYAYRGRLFADYVGPEAHVDRGSIVQLDPTSGDPVWTDEQPLSWSIGAYDTVVGYTEHDDHRGLTARAIPDGTVEWEQRFENYTWPESVANGRIITTRSGGESSQFEGSLVAMDAATGDQSWELEAEHGFKRGSGLTIDSGGVYAIDEPDQEDASGTIRAVAI